MTKAQKAERDEAITRLREWIKPGDTVYTILEHVSRSGMQREIRVILPTVDGVRGGQGRGDFRVDFLHPNHAIATALGLRQGKRDGLIMGGCGMDMGFALVYELSHALYGHRYCTKCKRTIPYDYPTNVTCGECDGEIEGGYKCLGKGKCPSNYHSNHRDQITCEGTMVYNPDGPNTGHRCYRPNGFNRFPVPDNWPRKLITIDGVKEYSYPLACIEYLAGEIPVGTKDLVMQEDGSALQVCPTCKGDGSLPNPEGPEKFDLTHTDGYALRQRWL